MAKDTGAKERGKDLVKEFVAQVLEGSMTVTRDAETMINARIAQIDHLLSIQLNEILHNPTFQKLEGSWRGLKYLLDQSETSDQLKIKVLNVSKRELLRDLQRAPEFDQSALFKKVYEEEFGIFGGAPFASLIGDYEFGKGPEDIELLERIAQTAASAPRAVPVRGQPRVLQPGELRAARRAARSVQGLRHHRVRQVEVLPRQRRFALRRAYLPARAGPPALRQGHQVRRRVQL